MTTVVAVEDKNGVTFASDSRVTSNSINDGWVDKVVCNGQYVFAAAGYLRTIQVLEYASLPDAPTGDGRVVDRFVTQELIPAIMKAAKESAGSNSDDLLNSGIVLVAVRGRIYEITGDAAWTRSRNGRYAIGSGSDYALGALAAGASAKKAVKIAAAYDSGTNDDVRVMRIPTKGSSAK